MGYSQVEFLRESEFEKTQDTTCTFNGKHGLDYDFRGEGNVYATALILYDSILSPKAPISRVSHVS